MAEGAGDLTASWFNINVGDGFYHYHRAWNDDLSMPFASLPDYIDRVKQGESLKRPVEQLLAERQQLIADYRELLSTDDERAAYDQMITLAHRVFPYVEGHKFYCEHWYTNLFFNKIREFGALLAQHGVLRRRGGRVPADALRVQSAIIDLMTAWSTGSAPRGSAALAADCRGAARRPFANGRSMRRRPPSAPCRM